MDYDGIILCVQAWLTDNGHDQSEIGAVTHTEGMNVWEVEVKIPDRDLLLVLNHDDGKVMNVGQHFGRSLFESAVISDSLTRTRPLKRSLFESAVISDSLARIHVGMRRRISLLAGASLIVVACLDYLSQPDDNIALVIVQGLLAILGFMAGYFSSKRVRVKTTENDVVLQNKVKTDTNYGFLLFVGISVMQICIIYLYHGPVQVPISILLVVMAFISAHYVFSIECFSSTFSKTHA